MNPEEDAKQFDKVNWNIKHKMRENGLQIDQPPPLSLGSPAIDYDVIKIRQAKDRNPTYSPKEIYYDILKESVPLYKFKDVYSVDDLSGEFNVYELEKQKKKYLSNGVPEYETEFIDKLIKAANDKREAFLKCEADRATHAMSEWHNNQKESSCVTMGGRIKNIFRKKNKSKKNKSKRVNKRIKKNKRYSRKSSKKYLHQ